LNQECVQGSWFLQRFKKDDDIDLVNLVDRFGLDVMVYNDSLITAAAGKGAIKCLHKLTELGASLHPEKGRQPIRNAILFRQLECLIVLIEKGASFSSDLLRDILLGPMDSGYDTEPNPISAIINCFRKARTALLERVLKLLLERVEGCGYEPSLKPFLEKHFEYQKNPIIQASILRYITENGYDEGLEAVFEKEQALFEEAVERIIQRAEKIGYEESLLFFIKRHPCYVHNPIIQKVFRERASAQGYEPSMAFLASLCPALFQNIVKGVVDCAQTQGYQFSLRDFVENHGKDTSEKDVAYLQGIIAKHQEEMGKILLERQIKEASLRQEVQRSSFFPFPSLCFWRSSKGGETDIFQTKGGDRSPLLKSY
jgi:hypothetical protein